jgi:hypothetical protein
MTYLLKFKIQSFKELKVKTMFPIQMHWQLLRKLQIVKLGFYKMEVNVGYKLLNKNLEEKLKLQKYLSNLSQLFAKLLNK